MNPVFRPISVLVTGGAGFIGSHVAHALVQQVETVVIVDKLDICASLFNIPHETTAFIQLDIATARPEDLVEILAKYKIDCVLHFAAHTHVDNSFGNSLSFTMNNTYGTHVLLEACRMWGQIQRFINVSTDEVYGESLEESHEETILDPTNPYAAAKAAAEMIARAYHTSFGLPVITTRGNNVYGPKQFPEKLIPKFIMLGIHGLTLPIHGKGDSLRSFVYIDDAVDAYLTILRYGTVGDTYNISGTCEMSVMDVARDIQQQFDVGLTYIKDRPFNDRRYCISNAKLADLGWKQKIDWTTGLQKTVDWYQNSMDWW